MHETNPLEKQLQSWMPRRPSGKIARRLFAPAPHVWCAVEVWNWLTPAAACLLTLLVAVYSANCRLPRLSRPDNATFFTTAMINASGSNVAHTLALSKMDENVEWNVWPHPLVAAAMDVRNLTTNR